jgi:hypothetical protein
MDLHGGEIYVINADGTGETNLSVLLSDILSSLKKPFILIIYSSRIWKYCALTVAAYLLNVRLVLHSKNVPIAGGTNVVAGGSCPTLSEMSSIIMP